MGDTDDSSDEECLAVLKGKSSKTSPEKPKKRRRKAKAHSNDASVSTVKMEYPSDNEAEFQNAMPNVEAVQSTSAMDRSDADQAPVKKKRRRLYTCECGTVFTEKEALRLHRQEHHKSVDDEATSTTPIHNCHMCGKNCLSSRELHFHLQYHNEGTWHMCEVCHRRFQTQTILDQHMMIHEKRIFTCVKCPGEYNSKALLDDHYRRCHIRECPLCKSQDCKCNKLNTLGHSNSYGEENESNPNDSGILDYTRTTIDGDRTDNSDFLDDTSEQMYVQCLYNVPVKREDLSHPTQCAIVTKMHKGKSVAEICKLYHLTPEIVNEIWEERDNYVIPKKIGMKSSKYMNSVLDSKILDWFYRQRELGVQVTGKMLINVAEEFAKECGFVIFNGNIKWLDRFKMRHKISLRPTPVKREKARGPNDAKWKEQFLSEIWPEVSKGFDFDDIYTADEVGVFYNSSKGRIRKHTGRKFIHGFEKDRFAIFMCTNMTGSDRRKLLVCGAEDPLPHSHRNPNTLPVTYIRHSQTHFTTVMFEEYVKTWNRQLQMDSKKALLILDRASIHTKMSLTHLKLVFVPWKASTGLMPIKHGVFNRFRDEFRRLILQEKVMNAIRGVDRNLTCLEGLELVHKAWNRVPSETIITSFEIIGYKVPEKPEVDVKTPKVSNNDEERICTMLQDYDVHHYYTDLTNMDMYLTVDEELLTAQGTNGSVFGGNHKVSDPLLYGDLEKGEILPIAEHKTDVVEREKLILKARALEDLEIVRKFLEGNKTSYETFKVFMDIEKYLLRNPPKLQK